MRVRVRVRVRACVCARANVRACACGCACLRACACVCVRVGGCVRMRGLSGSAGGAFVRACVRGVYVLCDSWNVACRHA